MSFIGSVGTDAPVFAAVRVSAGNGVAETISASGSSLAVDPDSTTGATVAPVSVTGNGVGVTVDNDTIVHTTGTLSVGANSIGAAELDETDNYAFSGTTTAVTQSANDNSTNIATTAYVDAATGALATVQVEYFTLTGTDITNKYVTLASTPAVAADVMLDIISGTTQEESVDYQMDGGNPDRLDWDGLGLDGELAIGDKIRVMYTA